MFRNVPERCVKVDPEWDYECAWEGRFKRHGFAMMVDGDSVTNQTAP